MGDIVYRDDVLKTISECAIYMGGNPYSACSVLKKRINKLPTVDAVPVVHGRWVHHPEIGWGSTWLCSKCGEKTVETVMGEPRDKFCPMCGADMRKDGEHETD